MRTLWKTKFMRAHWKLLVSVFLILFVKCLHLVTNSNSPIFLLQINGRYSPQLTSLQAPLTVSISTQAFGARKVQWEERINKEKPQWGIKENNGLSNATPNNHQIFFSNLLFGEKENLKHKHCFLKQDILLLLLSLHLRLKIREACEGLVTGRGQKQRYSEVLDAVKLAQTST